MEKDWLERTELLTGKEELARLKNAHVLIVGLGGVGSFAAEFIARAGVGKMTIIDGDTVDITNVNRQLPALHSTVGKDKVEIVGQRLLDINPSLELIRINEFIEPKTPHELIKNGGYDYVMDCIDSISPKLNLIAACRYNKVKCISSMGAGGKTDPAKVYVKDISKTHSCVMAQKIRKRLKKEFNINRGVRSVFSTETAIKSSLKLTDGSNYKKSFYGTISYMPALFGLHAASEVIRYLQKEKM